jgi:hypothetical protein
MAEGDRPYLVEDSSGRFVQRTKGWAGIHFASDTAITITTAGTYYVWATATESIAKGITTTVATGRINLTVAGVYLINFHVSFVGTATEKITAAVHKSGTIDPAGAVVIEVVGGTDEEQISGSCLVSSDGTNYVDLRFTSSSSSTSITVKRAGLNAVQI